MIQIIKNKIVEKCILCDTFIDRGENCLIFFSEVPFSEKQDRAIQSVKLHLECSETLGKEINLIIKEEMLKNLK